MSKKNVIILQITFCLAISFIVFVIMMNSWYTSIYIPDDAIAVYKQLEKTDNKIFLIGSSHVVSLNATYIKNQISTTSVNYEVYNIARGSDTPRYRILTIDQIVDTKPKLVLYGIGYRDFELEMANALGQINTPRDSEENFLLPNARDMFDNMFHLFDLHELNFDFISAPKFLTMTVLFQHSLSENKNNTKTISIPNTPFAHITAEEVSEQLKGKSGYMLKCCDEFHGIDTSYNNRNYISLTKMLKEFKENNIKVAIFTTPYHKIYRDKMSDDDQARFELILKEISNKYDVNVYFLHDKYDDLDMWHDVTHLTFQNSVPYSKDIANIIVKELS